MMLGGSNKLRMERKEQTKNKKKGTKKGNTRKTQKRMRIEKKKMETIESKNI